MLQLVDRMNKSITVAKFYIAIGFVAGITCLYFSYEMYSFTRAAKEAEGSVIKLSNNDGSYFPVVSFRTKFEIKEFQSDSGCNPSCYRIGEKVTVLYSDSSLQTPLIDSFQSKYGLSLLLAAVSLGFTGGGVFNLRRNKSAT